MIIRILSRLLVFVLAIVTASSLAAEDHSGDNAIELSPGILGLLRAEMREIAGGIQAVPVALASAQWESIQSTSAQIRESYIMEKQLTPAQAQELETVLPEKFKLIDAEFHDRADKLGAAAAAHDAEGVAFHYSRMLESCAQCHSEFAVKRFPGFIAVAPPDHHH